MDIAAQLVGILGGVVLMLLFFARVIGIISWRRDTKRRAELVRKNQEAEAARVALERAKRCWWDAIEVTFPVFRAAVQRDMGVGSVCGLSGDLNCHNMALHHWDSVRGIFIKHTFGKRTLKEEKRYEQIRQRALKSLAEWNTI